MELNLNSNKDINLISSYNENSFTVNEKQHTASFLITPTSITNWQISSIEEISLSLAHIIACAPDTLIIGTGEKTIMLSAEKLQELIQHKISYEIMSSVAAAKTYNVLAMDNRHILAAIFI
jgi:uncharacterized protein